MWRTNLAILAVTLGVIGFYTAVAHVIPQLQSEVPAAVSLGSGQELHLEQPVATGVQVTFRLPGMWTPGVTLRWQTDGGETLYVEDVSASQVALHGLLEGSAPLAATTFGPVTRRQVRASRLWKPALRRPLNPQRPWPLPRHASIATLSALTSRRPSGSPRSSSTATARTWWPAPHAEEPWP